MSKEAPKISSGVLDYSEARNGRYLVGASALGWRPGQFPVTFICEFPNGLRVFNWERREPDTVCYRQTDPADDRDIEIYVFEDCH